MQVKLIALTKPEIEIDGVPLTPEGLIAYCARVSSPNQENPNYAKLLQYCIRMGHWSVFEQVDMTVEIITTRAIAPQILRHRSFVFQEHCISGDSLVTVLAENGVTDVVPIKSLYSYQSDPLIWGDYDKGIRVYDQETKTLKRSLIKEVFYTGTKSVYEVKLADGKRIKTTMRHKFLTKSGFQPLENLTVGDFVALNGVPAHQDKEWMMEVKQKCIGNKTGVPGIADAAGVSYHTIRKWLKIHGLQFTKMETASMRDIWNKGLPKEKQPRYGKTVSEETRLKQQESARKGSDSNLYVNGNSEERTYRQRIFDWQNKYKNHLFIKFNNKCCSCGSKENLQIDHIKNVGSYPELAYNLDNLQILCSTCHKVKTTKERQQTSTCKWRPIESITYIGEEDTYDLEVEHGSHNYVANSFIVHNSQRYAEATSYEIYEARRQDTKNRQNSLDDLSEADKDWFEAAQETVWTVSFSKYQEALERQIAKECARTLLPLNTVTRLYMKGSVRSWIHYFAVRCAPATQKEHRDIALAIRDEIFAHHFPTIYPLLTTDD